jgi:phage baseplate assembly protein W
MEKASLPEADTTMMFAAMEAPAPVPLSDEVEQAIKKTRIELEKILNAATFEGDVETIIEIATTINEFEAKVNALRASSF